MFGEGGQKQARVGNGQKKMPGALILPRWSILPRMPLPCLAPQCPAGRLQANLLHAGADITYTSGLRPFGGPQSTAGMPSGKTHRTCTIPIRNKLVTWRFRLHGPVDWVIHGMCGLQSSNTKCTSRGVSLGHCGKGPTGHCLQLAASDPPTHPQQETFPRRNNEIYERGRKLEADFSTTNFFGASLGWGCHQAMAWAQHWGSGSCRHTKHCAVCALRLMHME